MNKKILLPMILAITMLIGACATPTAQPTAVPAPTTAPTVAPTLAPTIAPSPAPLTFTDASKRTVKLPKPAQRFISIAPSNTEILFAVGAGKQVVGRDDLSDFPAEAKSVTSIGSTFKKLNTEAIVALKPDLVLAANLTAAEQVKSLEDLGITVYVLGNPKDLEGLYQNLITVGQLTGHEDDAKKLNESLKKRVSAVTDKTKVVTAKPKVFYEIDATDPLKPWTTGAGTFIDTLITMAGGQNVGALLKDPFAQMSSEEVVKQNPDIILLGDAKFGTTVDSVGKRAGWNAIAAVKNNKVLPFDDDLASRPGPRLVDGLEALAKVLQPDLFK
ncbi:MAG: ABC transporter substrate-binding protein [Chloroflexi bacterium]|nr:ABC transporter substrate-binding protein [Chloroflexota bacterium]